MTTNHILNTLKMLFYNAENLKERMNSTMFLLYPTQYDNDSIGEMAFYPAQRELYQFLNLNPKRWLLNCNVIEKMLKELNSRGVNKSKLKFLKKGQN